MKAKAKWESIIKNDIPNTYRYKKGDKCWEDFTKLIQIKGYNNGFDNLFL